MREDVLPINSPFHKEKDKDLLLPMVAARLLALHYAERAHVYTTTSTTTVPSVLRNTANTPQPYQQSRTDEVSSVWPVAPRPGSRE